ncbi:hypothetical protein ACIBCT_06015 [Streptosporangium sp. NPDC050855]|uniref:hypothetical protein n=1 Tax=Streptosporangium sp. NPDC050855 TaxID=3366194 RepID=UPI0037A718C7
MHKSLIGVVLLTGILLALAVVATVMVFGAGPSPEVARSRSSPPALVPSTDTAAASEEPPAVAPPDEDTDEYEEELERLPAGRAVPLAITQATRDKLAAASRAAAGPSAKSAEVATRDGIYYGMVFGESRKTDTYYVIAFLDGLHFWVREGRGEWRFKGDYDARVCAPPVPTSLYAAWGLSFSTRDPNEYELCPE